MTPELLAAVAAEIESDPAGVGYAAFVAQMPGRVTELLNEPARAVMASTRFVTALTVLAEVGPGGATALRNIERFANAEPGQDDPPELVGLRDSAYFAMGPIRTTGVDIGHPTTQLLLDALVQLSVITEPQAEGLKGMAIQPCSRYALLAGRINARVGERDVRAAISLMSS